MNIEELLCAVGTDLDTAAAGDLFRLAMRATFPKGEGFLRAAQFGYACGGTGGLFTKYLYISY
ncbi:MAG: hypothetical protein IJD20_04980 [Oscillospiraceae bacterium]|nr:hypothetical protein [Oscillospiraceae bacterium]